MQAPRLIPRVRRHRPEVAVAPIPRPDEAAAALRSDLLLEVLCAAESAMRRAIDLLDTAQIGDLERGGDLAWALGRIKKRRRELESGLWIGRTVSGLGDPGVEAGMRRL